MVGQHGSGPLGYSSLLETLAPLPAARQGILAGFFEGGPNDEQSDKQPSRAHRAIAELVRRGTVRVIVTTNFDRLMEQALEAAGVSAQVIASPEAVKGMAPLAHARATLIKLHGDYRDLGSRNTPAELSEYPQEWTRLLDQVFDEYGLLISGWSAEWDSALVAALEGTVSRRYPMYWDERSSKGDNARRILAARQGQVIQVSGADELFGELLENLESLDSLSAPALTTAMAVARLKRYLPDPVRRIDLHDLVMGAVDTVVDHLNEQPVASTNGEPVAWATLEDIYEGHFGVMTQLAQLLITGVWHDDDGTHDALWHDVMQRLVDVGSAFPLAYNRDLRAARLIPAFVGLAIIGITASRRNREGLLLSIATTVEGRTRVGVTDLSPSAQVLTYRRVLDDEIVNRLPSNADTRWSYPTSHYFLERIRRYFSALIPDEEEYKSAYYGFEYRLGVIQAFTQGGSTMRGEYAGEWAWREDEPLAEIHLLRQASRGYANDWMDFFQLKHSISMSDALTQHRGRLEQLRVWG